MAPLKVPAVCERCGRPFPSGLVVDSVARLTLSGNRSGPCPWCGNQWGVIPDGVFEVAGGSLKLLEELPTTRDELLVVAQVLREAIDDGVNDPDEIEKRLRKRVPGAAALSALIRDPATGTTLSALGIVLAMVMYLLG